jgi:hypothetical protein
MITDWSHSAAGPTNRRGRASRCTAISLAALPFVLTLPSSAAGALPTQAPNDDRPAIISVSGRQVPVDADQGMYRMRGDLLGRWVVLSAETLPPGYYETQAQWRVVQTGRKQFVGCLDRDHNRRCDSSDTSGERRFGYLFWVKYDPKTGLPIEGKCIHPITSGTRDFAGARGVLTMRDAPLGHEKVLTYQGEIVLNAVDNEPVTSGPAAPIDQWSGMHERSAAESEPGLARCGLLT